MQIAAAEAARRSERSAEPLLRLPIIQRMGAVEGWLTDEEADLLIAGLCHALAATPATTVVELGCYRGRATVVLGSVARALRPTARVYAIDAHDGLVGALDASVRRTPPTLAAFQRTIAETGLGDVVVTVQRQPYEVEWAEPIAFLLVDGLHDYASVSRDFFAFEPHLVDGALIAFHDYADYFPGVQAFADELVASRRYRRAAHAGSLLLLVASSDR